MAGKSRRGDRDGSPKRAGSAKAEPHSSARAGEAADPQNRDDAPAAPARSAARRVRTPPPSPVGGSEPAQRPEPGEAPPTPGGRRPARQAGKAARARPEAGHLGGPGAPHRTPLPPVEGEAGPQRRAEPLLGLVTEPLQQMRFLQDFLRSPVPVSLAAGQAEATSSPTEIGARISELNYQLKVLAALQTVLTEELQDLERNLAARRDGAAEDGRQAAQNGPAA